MSLSPDERRERMDALRQVFLKQLPRMIGEALASLGEVRADPASGRASDDARRRLHTLAGTLGTFGYLSPVEGIRSLERLLAAPPGSASPDELDRLVVSLRSEVETICGPAVQGEAP